MENKIAILSELESENTVASIKVNDSLIENIIVSIQEHYDSNFAQIIQNEKNLLEILHETDSCVFSATINEKDTEVLDMDFVIILVDADATDIPQTENKYEIIRYFSEKNNDFFLEVRKNGTYLTVYRDSEEGLKEAKEHVHRLANVPKPKEEIVYTLIEKI